jgi:general secretion pathway protein D
MIVLAALVGLAQEPPENVAISLRLPNADLLQVVSIIAGELKMNYVVDPQVKGLVTINTMGEVRRSDLLPLLQAILRVNGATAVQAGNIWRIVLLKDAARVPVVPQLFLRELPADERLILNVVPMRFASAADMAKLLSNYISETGNLAVHESGNILLITDTSRSVQRLMDLLGILDSESFAGQRVRLFTAQNASPTMLGKELEAVFSGYALSSKTALQFLPMERLNALLVVSPNPTSFAEVQKWIEKLDVVRPPSAIRNYVYKVQNGNAEDLARLLAQLYGVGLVEQRAERTSTQQPSGTPGASGAGTAAVRPPPAPAPTRLVGQSLVDQAAERKDIRVVPDAINNLILVQASPSDWEEIRATLRDLDIVPRQVMIEAQIFEVNLSGELSMGVSAFLRSRSALDRKVAGSFAATGSGESLAGQISSPLALSASVGTLIGQARELLFFLNATENRARTKVISAPTVLASDNMEARIQVGAEVPLLTGVGYTGAQAQGGGSIFTNSIANRDTGVILMVKPRINSGGLVSLQIQQEVSVPQAPSSPLVPSPTIQKRAVSTTVTVQDGETIALGGIIQETRLNSRNRVPLLGDIPGLGLLFGNTSTSQQRTELIVLLTPRVLSRLSDASAATEELKTKLKALRKTLDQAY